MKHNLKTFPRLEEVPSTLEDALRYICQVTEYRMGLEAELRQLKPFVLTKEDHLNVQKWQTATSMMIQAKMRVPYSQSEHDTSDKLKRMVEAEFIEKKEVLGVAET